jgi:thiamine-monophosphate kinase
LSVDSLAEDVHFRREWCSARDLGWRSLHSALSDLAASRAQPLGFLLSLSVPAADFADPRWIDEVVAGIGEAASSCHCPVLGGDTTRSRSGLVISITVLGQSDTEPLSRSGARCGDLLQVSGRTGWAGLAVEELLAATDPGEVDMPERASRAWRRPIARFDLLDSLGHASAAIDISDGLLADARHLCSASECGLVLDRQQILDPELVSAIGEPRALRLALSGGEDYEILACSAQPLEGFTAIGEVVAGAAIHWRDGGEVKLDGCEGWDHGSAT